jgi:hypothetical protein
MEVSEHTSGCAVKVRDLHELASGAVQPRASLASRQGTPRNVTSRRTELSPIAETRFVTKKTPINHGTTHLAAELREN